MLDDRSFQELIRRVRSRDDAAAAELVRLYEPEIRRIARVRLGDSRLRQLLDSTDICQSVLANFFVRVATGQFDLETPGQLLRLLVTMACNKITDQRRRQQAGRRSEQQRRFGDPKALEAVVDPAATPSRIVTAQELLTSVRSRLSDAERYLADQRALGRTWDDLGTELGSSPEALRKRLARAVDRVTQQLGLDEVTE